MSTSQDLRTTIRNLELMRFERNKLRRQNVRIMQALMDGLGGQPLSLDVGAVFDECATRVQWIDDQQPILDAQLLQARADLHLAELQEIRELAQQRAEVAAALAKAAERELQEKPTDIEEPITDHGPPRWRDWRSIPVDHRLAVPVTEADGEEDSDGDHIMADELDRRANAMLSWAPWARREKHSRRYEGFRQGWH